MDSDRCFAKDIVERDMDDMLLLDNLDGASNFADLRTELDMIEEDSLKFSDSVEKALASIAKDGDPFSMPDFNMTAYINQLFPTEQSLCKSCVCHYIAKLFMYISLFLGNIDDVMLKVKNEIKQINGEIAEVVQNRNISSLDGQKVVIDCKLSIQELFSKIREIKSKTDMSENMVKEITRDIKQLDVGKKNLTASITTLNHLYMLLSGMEHLQNYAK